MRSRLWVAACLALVLAPAGAFAQCGCDNPVCLNDCVGYGCLCDMPPPPDCTCGLPYCFGMGCLCGVGLCECPGLGQECMYCNSGCPSPDPRCTGAVACSSPDGCGNEQDCFCDSTYCENDGPMCCMGGQKIVCHEAGCQGGNCAVQQPPACANACTEQNHCASCGGTECMCEGPLDKNCDDFCGQPPCGGARVCVEHGCGGGDCVCPPYYCRNYTIQPTDKPYPCACWNCSFLTCPCLTQGECNSANGCPLPPDQTCGAECTFGQCLCGTPQEHCGHSGCVCQCTSYDNCQCFGIGDCGRDECQPSDDGFGANNT